MIRCLSLFALFWGVPASAQDANDAPIPPAIEQGADNEVVRETITFTDEPIAVSGESETDTDTDTDTDIQGVADPVDDLFPVGWVYEPQGPPPPTVEDLAAELDEARATIESAREQERAAKKALEQTQHTTDASDHTDASHGPDAGGTGESDGHSDSTHGPAHDKGAPEGWTDPVEPADPDTAVAPADTLIPVPVRPALDSLPIPRFLPFLPTLPFRGLQPAIILGVLTLLSWGTARGLSSIRERLAPTGLLPTLVLLLQQGLRLVALFFALGLIAAILPRNLEPALPWVVLAGALAVGWSARDVMPDFIAGVVLAAERRIIPGRWISTKVASGVVEQLGFRVTWLHDATGRRIAVPNREFLSGAVVTDRGTWPSVEVVLRVPHHHTPSQVHRALEDAILISPWAAPVPPDMVREEQEPGMWRVRARVLEGRFADRFEGALREHVEETLARQS